MVSALGTDGELGRHPGGFSRLGVFGDTWLSPKEGPKGLSVWLSGHVACSEGESEGGGVRKAFGVTFSRASGHKAYFEGVFRLDLRDAWHSSKEGPKGFSKKAFRRVLGRLRKRFLGRASGTRGILRRAPKGGLPGGMFERVSEGGGLPEGLSSLD